MNFMSALFAAKAAMFAGGAAVDAVQNPVVDDKPAVTAEVPASYQESNFDVLNVQADSFDDYEE